MNPQNHIPRYTKDSVFHPRVKTVLEGFYQRTKTAAWSIPLLSFGFAGCAIVALATLGFEYELLYRIFSALAGDENQYWDPAIMAFTSLILVAALFFLGQTSRAKEHPALIFVRRFAGMLVPIYLLGLGALLALLIFNDSSGLFIPDATGFALEDETPDNAWLNALMEHFTGPMASLLISTGVGAFAIINVFIADAAIDRAVKNAGDISARRAAYKSDKYDMDSYEAAQDKYTDTVAQMQNFVSRADEMLAREVASDVLLAVNDALKPIQRQINNHRFMSPTAPILPESSLKIEEIEHALQPFEALNADDLITLMTQENSQ